MKKGIYLIWGKEILYTKDNKLTGVGKKILDQVNALNILNIISCELLVIPSLGEKKYIRKGFYSLFLDIFKNYEIEKKMIDFIYIRRFIPTNYGLIQLLKRIKYYNPSCKIIYEIPTFPYDFEHKKSLKSKIILLIDKIFRYSISKYVDRIVTYSNHDKIFGVKTIKIINGIKCANIPVVNNKICKTKIINLIAVANFSFWHGYERIIRGLNNYYLKDSVYYEVNLHLCGDGLEIDKYKTLVNKYNLEKHVFFHGFLSEKYLDEVYDECCIGVSSLGGHRKNLYLSSELKSREYLARGLPIISSIKIDCIPEHFEYCMYVPEDESNIDINKIIEFYEKIYLKSNKLNVNMIIRDFAEKNIDVSVTMRPIINYIILESE